MRELLAIPAFWGLKSFRRFGPGQGPGFNAILLHHVPTAQFGRLEALVEYILSRHGILTPAEAEIWIREGTSVPGPKADSTPVLFTFDDGFASNAEAATAILDPRDVKSIFFICPGLIDADPVDQQDLVVQNVFQGRSGGSEAADSPSQMTWDQLRHLHNSGHTIGAHSMSHHRLADLQDKDIEAEVGGSKRHIEEQIQAAVDWFAYPFGDIGSVSRDAMVHINRHFKYCRSGVRGRNTGGTNPLTVLAQHLDLGSSLAYQKLILENGLDSRYRSARETLSQLAG